MIRRIAGWWSSLTLGILVVGPPAALGVCALVDLGPRGEARASLFPIAVAALDPFVWTSLRFSAGVAASASLAAILGGTLLGRLVGSAGGSSRTAALIALGIAAASPPFLLAMGASAWLGVEAPAAFVGSRRLPVDVAWIVWTAAATLPAVALGALTHLSAFDRLSPSCREAAALAGGSRIGVRRRLTSPLLRPAMGRIGAVVFASTLADPGPPLLLGLRRTLGAQMVLTATGDDPFPRLASLGLFTVLTASAWRLLLRLWSGPDRAATSASGPHPRPPAHRLRILGRGAIAAATATIVAASAFGIVSELRPGDAGTTGSAAVGPRPTDPGLGRILSRSLILGLGAAFLTLVSDRVVARLEAMAGPAAATRFRRLAKLSAPPPLVAGVVVLALLRLPELAAASGWAEASPVLGTSVAERAPLATAALAAWLASASARIGRRPLASAADDAGLALRSDAAVLAGAGRGRARRLARRTNSGDGFRSFIAAGATAATALAPAVLVLASTRLATAGPSILLLHETPGGGPTAALLGLLVWGVALATGPILAEPRRITSTSGSPHA